MNYSVLETWLIIALAAIATGGWRLAGLLLADLISPESWVMQWVKAKRAINSHGQKRSAISELLITNK